MTRWNKWTKFLKKCTMANCICQTTRNWQNSKWNVWTGFMTLTRRGRPKWQNAKSCWRKCLPKSAKGATSNRRFMQTSADVTSTSAITFTPTSTWAARKRVPVQHADPYRQKLLARCRNGRRSRGFDRRQHRYRCRQHRDEGHSRKRRGSRQSVSRDARNRRTRQRILLQGQENRWRKMTMRNLGL